MGVRRRSKTVGGVRSTTTVNTKKGVTTSTSTGNKQQRATYSQGPDGRIKKTTTYNTATGYVRKTKNLSPKSKKKTKSAKLPNLPIYIWVAIVIGLIIGVLI